MERILTEGEAFDIADLLFQRRSGDGWPETNVNLASARETSTGEVVIELLGMVERHASLLHFVKAYGLDIPGSPV